MKLSPETLNKYNIPAPRYTSYPTVPYWLDPPTTTQWLSSLQASLSREETCYSLYIHIPYCEQLCTFCGCNTSITRNHNHEAPYVELIHKEWLDYCDKIEPLKDRPLKQIHLGGGTPTFLSATNLVNLLKPILKMTKVDENDFEASLEVDPRRTNAEQLRALYDVGFRRVSMGVQDFNAEVQRLVNRIQPFSITKDLMEVARTIGYTSVNFDLIYGLPKQNIRSFEETIHQTIDLMPERIALYSFAKVPWIKPAQRLFKDEDLPVGVEKRALYDMARHYLLGAGYMEIGMDHFALKEDSLYQAHRAKELHRNFMGYTDKRTNVLLGLGVSAISESSTCFHQNEKVLPVYQRRVEQGEIPTLRGHVLSEEDIRQREQILRFMTRFSVPLHNEAQESDLKKFLKPLIEDELLTISEGMMKLTEKGHPFLRNACMGLDMRLRAHKPQTQVFSQSL